MKAFKFFFPNKYPNETFDDDDFADIVMIMIAGGLLALGILITIIKLLCKEN